MAFSGAAVERVRCGLNFSVARVPVIDYHLFARAAASRWSPASASGFDTLLIVNLGCNASNDRSPSGGHRRSTAC
eukprot:COSAG01_NODE_6528_length_3620_cov_5.223800_3_plen_75_part_00